MMLASWFDLYDWTGEANALSEPPGEYDRKVETQTNWRGGAQPVEHVV